MSDAAGNIMFFVTEPCAGGIRGEDSDDNAQCCVCAARAVG